MKANAIDPPVEISGLRQLDAQAEAAGVEDADPASYRDLTKEEVLDRFAAGYQDLLDGNFRPAEDVYEELGWHSVDDDPQG